MESIDTKIFTNLFYLIIEGDNLKSVTKYQSEKQIIRVKRKTFKAYKNGYRKGDNLEFVVTIGKPNYQEREFIKKCKKVGEKFPLRRIQYKIITKPMAKCKGKKKGKK